MEFAKLGLMGATVVTGSGDWGVGCSGSGRFRPDFPSSSPYIVSTGATTLAGDGSAADAEVGVTFSSGGFSDHFPMPAMQRDAEECRREDGVEHDRDAHLGGVKALHACIGGKSSERTALSTIEMPT